MDEKIMLLTLLVCGTIFLCVKAWNITGMPKGQLDDLHEEFRGLRGFADPPMALMDVALSSCLFRVAVLLFINGPAAFLVFLEYQPKQWWWLIALAGLLFLEWLFIGLVALVRQRKYGINLNLSRRVLALHQQSSPGRR